MRAKEGLGCSQFEAEALTNLVKEVYSPWLSQPEAIQVGQLAMTAVSATGLHAGFSSIPGPLRGKIAGGVFMVRAERPHTLLALLVERCLGTARRGCDTQ